MKPNEKRSDIAIFNGGFSALGAALKLAGQGKKVIIIESGSSLGWECTRASMLNLGSQQSKIINKISDLLNAKGGLKNNLVDPPIAEVILNKIITEAGIEIIFYNRPSRISITDDQIDHVTISGKSGDIDIYANEYMDATENGTLFTGEKLELPSLNPSYEYTLYVNYPNGLSDELAKNQEYQGEEFKFFPGIWNNEMVLKFTSSSDKMSDARLESKKVLEAFRKEYDPENMGIVSHCGFELLPVYSSEQASEQSVKSKFKNLHSSGIHSASSADLNNISGRIALGEKAAKNIISIATKTSGTVKELELNSTKEECDILICGGGTAGAVAAIAAGRQGAKTILLEASHSLGGIGTDGHIFSYYFGVAGGIQDEIDKRTEELAKKLCGKNLFRGFLPEAKKLVLEEMVAEAGVKVAYGSTLCEATVEPFSKKLTSANAVNAMGNITYEAKCFIDCSGDGDLAALAGAEFSYGRESDCLAHAYSQPSLIFYDKTLAHRNFDAGYCDPTDAFDISKARLYGVSQYYPEEKYTEANRHLCLAPLIGLRDSRHIKGEYTLTFNDQLEYREFEDVIAYSYAHYDNHAYDYENESEQSMLWVWALGNWQRCIGSEIPYRCLLPLKIDGLLVACRAISLEQDAHHQFRMQRDMQRLGEAAAIAAALSVKKNITPRQLDVKLIQKELEKSGALKDAANGYHDKSWHPDDNKFLISSLSADTEDKYLKTILLAIKGDKSVAPEILKWLQERNETKPEGQKTVELWKLAIALLGILKHSDAAPYIEKVLEDPESDLAAITVAIKALAKIKSPSSIPVIEKLIGAPELKSKTLQTLQGSIAPINVLWRLELTIAEALAEFGVIRSDLVEKYINSPESVIKRYALKAQKTLAA
jgi:ribulose 1,5-bisphosphate synthetase/thiazole synthase